MLKNYATTNIYPDDELDSLEWDLDGEMQGEKLWESSSDKDVDGS